jgi:hypothetical protein
MQVNDEFLLNINSNFPKLKYLDLNVSNITDISMNILAKMQFFKFIRIFFNSCVKNLVTDAGIIDNCSEFESFRLFGKLNITFATINALTINVFEKT